MKLSGLIVAIAVATTAASALPMPYSADLRFEGYSWETDANGGHPPSGGPGVAGNLLYGIGNALKVLDDQGTPIYDPADFGMEVTFYLHGLVSQGAIAYGPSSWRTNYVGGSVDVYGDNSPDYAPATGPTSYSGVTDGDLWLSADVVSFYTVYNTDTQVGFFGGTFQPTGGDMAPLVSGELTLIGASTGLPAAMPPAWTYDHRIKGDVRGEMIPEPGTALLVAVGLMGSAYMGAWRKR